MTEADPSSGGTPSLPPFDVRIRPPDLGPFLAGNTGIPGFTSFAAAAPGPHALILALTHGNEIAGAIVLERLLRAQLRPIRGTLTLGFVNLAAFARFDPRQPTLTRFIDEDMNRLWDPAVLEGPRQSAELSRAREILPALQAADLVLDLHSMLWPSEPLMLCGPSPSGRTLASHIGLPQLVVADRGHASGQRIIDHPRFIGNGSRASAVLLEAGQHWQEDTVEVAHHAVASFLRHLRMVKEDVALPPPLPHPPQRHAEVTEAVTVASNQFSFVRPFRGGEIIVEGGTLIAQDGETEIRTPYDNCLLVMPSLHPSRGHTAIRLARFLGS